MPHPYRALPDKAFWRRSVAQIKAADIDPVGLLDLQITPEMKVANRRQLLRPAHCTASEEERIQLLCR